MASEPEHYREAERLLVGHPIPADRQHDWPNTTHWAPNSDDVMLAQAHLMAAQLALTVDALDAAGTLSPIAIGEWLQVVRLT